MKSNEEKLLRENFLFSGLEENRLHELCTFSSFSKGEQIFGGKKTAGKLGLLLSGRAVAVCAQGTSLNSFSAGDMFGAASVFCDPDKEPFSCITAASDCRVIFITAEAVRDILRHDPEKAIRYISFLSDRVSFLNRRIATFTGGEAVSRLAKHLVDSADSEQVCKGINFSSLAKSLGISRASLYRAKAALEGSQIITLSGHDIKINDLSALKNIF